MLRKHATLQDPTSEGRRQLCRSWAAPPAPLPICVCFLPGAGSVGRALGVSTRSPVQEWRWGCKTYFLWTLWGLFKMETVHTKTWQRNLHSLAARSSRLAHGQSFPSSGKRETNLGAATSFLPPPLRFRNAFFRTFIFFLFPPERQLHPPHLRTPAL